MGIAYLVGHLSEFNYNAWYGGNSKRLIDTTITQIEDGNIDRVMSVLRRLNLDYRPTYENRARYDILVRQAVSQMKGEYGLQDTKWETSPFSRETWVGHWQEGTGYWIVISHLLDFTNVDSDFDIVRSGDSAKMKNVVISKDHKTVTFIEGDQWRHELKLVNKYEATHIWRHLDSGRIWQKETLHKLIRATPDQRFFTQQKEDEAQVSKTNP